jgi:O-antigen/teichoic acid export membrane protein
MGSFLKDVKKIGVGKLIIIGSLVTSSIIIARVLGPEKNGLIAALTVYPILFMSFGGLGVSEATTYLLGRKILNEKEIRIGITQIWMLTSTIGLIVCFILLRYFSKSGTNIFYVILVLIPIPLTLFSEYFSGVYLAKGDIGFFNKLKWIPQLITLLLTAVFLLWFAMDIDGVLIALLGGPLIMAIALFIKTDAVRSFSLRVDWKVLKVMLGLGSIYALNIFVVLLNYRVDIIMLDFMSVPYEVGIYTKGMGITEYLWQITWIFSHVVMQRSAVAIDDKAFSLKISQLVRLSLIITGLASIGLFLFSEVIIIGMYGEAFRGSISVLKILLPGILLLTFHKVLTNDLAGKGKPWITLKAMSMALPVNVLCDFYWIPKYGANGAAIASTMSYSFATVVFLHFYSKEVGIPIKTILNFKKSDFDPIIDIIKKLRN